MKSAIILFVALLASAVSDVYALQVVTPKRSSLKAVTMAEDEAAFKQVFTGSIRVRGTFTARWTLFEELGETGVKQTRAVLSVVFRPDRRSANVLPYYSGRGNVREVWLAPAPDVVAKILPVGDAQQLIQRRKTIATGKAELLLTKYQIEVTCDQESYSAHVEQAFLPVMTRFASDKPPKVANGC